MSPMRVSVAWRLLSLLTLAQAIVLPPLAAGPEVQKRDCQANNCIRAVRATREGGGIRGASDCASYLYTTLIPPTTTITFTATQFGTASAESDVTVTTTIYSTASQTIDVTATQVVDTTAAATAHTTALTTIDVTATSTVSSTATSTKPTTVSTVIFTNSIETDHVTSTHTNTATAQTTVTSKVTIQARDAAPTTTTITPSDIPVYATPCSGAVKFSSACSCLGFTAATTVLAAPSVTITVPYTTTTTTSVTTVIVTVSTTSLSTATAYTTDSTLTILNTVGTSTRTIVDRTSSTTETVGTTTTTVVQSTQTLVTPVSTRTSTSTTTTQTVFTTDATVQVTRTLATSTSTTTQTTLTSCVNAKPTFALQVTNSNVGYNNMYIGLYTGNNGIADVHTMHAGDDTLDTAAHFHLDGTTVYDPTGWPLSDPANNFAYYLQFNDPAHMAQVGQVVYPCAISNGLLSCSYGTKNAYYVCPNVRNFLDLATPGSPAFPTCVGTVSLSVIPLCLW